MLFCSLVKRIHSPVSTHLCFSFSLSCTVSHLIESCQFNMQRHWGTKIKIATNSSVQKSKWPDSWLKGYSGVNLIHTLIDSLSRDKVCRPLANIVLASSETTARQQYTAVNWSKYKTTIKKPQIMFRTAPNFSNIRNRFPAHISRHQTFDTVAVFVGKYKLNSPPEKPSLLWRSPVSWLLSAVESQSNDHHWAAELYCTR